MSCRRQRVSWCVDLPLPATPGAGPKKEVLPQAHMSPPQPCGEAADEEDSEGQSADQSGLRRSSPVISGCRRRRRASSEDTHLPIAGIPSCLISGTLQLAEKKHRGRGMGHCSAPWQLEKENAHLLMVDLVLEMLEVLKWTLSQTGGQQERCHRNGHDGEHACAQPYSGVTQLQGIGGEVGSSWFSPLWKAERLGRQLLLDFERSCFPS
ncbi:uncharacterized protein LOC109517023 isoform X1 [Hippocampus comes]|uniref:uncharacterized protein LOC109517023 isoform X1 n=2 Tax=Hippocampus comes TaxID=109280 RepID=UPI00094EEE57|nr:PREDICTED: uncharacterized protein LOC109517023 isoform X1 [Hippocampus comes]